MSENTKLFDHLLNSIPIVKSLDLGIVAKEDSVEVKAPLSKHINYEGTAFGGSINTVCLLSCFLMARKILDELGLSDCSLVIQDSRIKYLMPVEADFTAIALKPSEFELEKIKNSIQRKSKARIRLHSNIKDNLGNTLVEFMGRYVATKGL